MEGFDKVEVRKIEVFIKKIYEEAEAKEVARKAAAADKLKEKAYVVQAQELPVHQIFKQAASGSRIVGYIVGFAGFMVAILMMT